MSEICFTCQKKLKDIRDCPSCAWTNSVFCLLADQEKYNYIAHHQARAKAAAEAQHKIEKLDGFVSEAKQKSKTLLAQNGKVGEELSRLKNEMKDLSQKISHQYALSGFVKEEEIEAQTQAKLEAINSGDVLLKKTTKQDLSCKVLFLNNDLLLVHFQKKQQVFPRLLIMLQSPQEQSLSTTLNTKYLLEIPDKNVERIEMQRGWDVWSVDLSFLANNTTIKNGQYRANLTGFHKRDSPLRYETESKLPTIEI